MTIINDLRAALDTWLLATPGLPPVAHQNVLFEPTTGQTFIKATFVPVNRYPAVRGLNPQQYYSGIYSLLICTPEGDGPGAAYDLADTLLARFEATTDISYTPPVGDTIILSVDKSQVGISYFDPPFYCTPINIDFYIYK
jgi:hypothetical protein